ncbi:hypothetical protein [Paradesulfitobacterium ferrireducens]|uniref:hypothetical protein n=1 Tax=Paradesulfitobacterium ferrireducens TaxID=2816476 RepID=UPI001A8C6A51|nr:hypothetical protein [Paradesulfitobacterium ferrireducens]
MAYAVNGYKELSGYRCPHCRQISYDYQWITLEEGKYQCPKCSLNTATLKLIEVVLLSRGRIWRK